MRREAENTIKRSDNGDRLAGYCVICLDGKSHNQFTQRHNLNPITAQMLLEHALESVNKEVDSMSEEQKTNARIECFAMAEGKEIKDQESFNEVVKDIRSVQDEEE